MIRSHLPNRSLLQEQMVVVGREVGGAGGGEDKDTRVFMATPQIEKINGENFKGPVPSTGT